MNTDDFIQAWRETLIGPGKSWVLFEHGTCVILMAPEDDLSAQAIALMTQWGPVHAGSPAGDFNTITLDNGLGWVVTCHHSDILSFVGREELAADTPDITLAAGLTGRGRRDQDAAELNVVHVEDNRSA